MHPSDATESFQARRKLLGAMISATGVSATALLGLNSTAAEASETAGSSAIKVPTEPELVAPEQLFAQARLRDYKTRRSSSWDRTGGNHDSIPVEPGQTATLLEIAGPGVVTHVWFTINSPDRMHLKNLVLRAWWDDESMPSVEVPIGDFFGLGLGEYCVYQSALVAVAPIKALNAYFQMPFASSARMALTNEGNVRTNSLYFAIDYVTLASLPDGLGRFHSQYRQAAPCKGWTNDWMSNGDPIVLNRKNLNGDGNYVFLEATGKGHLIGITQAVEQNQDDWFGEGDDMFFIDGDTLPTINGTGTEDYFNGAWGYGNQAFANMYQGVPYIVDPMRVGGRYYQYRWHIESPITFEKSIRATMEHGHANHRSDSLYSTAYWYQTEPHGPFPVLPPPADRIPKLFRVGGPGVQSVPGQ